VRTANEENDLKMKVQTGGEFKFLSGRSLTRRENACRSQRSRLHRDSDFKHQVAYSSRSQVDFTTLSVSRTSGKLQKKFSRYLDNALDIAVVTPTAPPFATTAASST
jgi:hypothetical protein